MLAVTDAIDALKLIGVGADVHMGMFDDSKYVAEVRQNPHVTRPSDIVQTADYDDNGEVIDNVPHAEPTQKLRVVDQKPIYAALEKEAFAFRNYNAFLTWMNSESTIDRVKNLKPGEEGVLPLAPAQLELAIDSGSRLNVVPERQ